MVRKRSCPLWQQTRLSPLIQKARKNEAEDSAMKSNGGDLEKLNKLRSVYEHSKYPLSNVQS